MNSLYYPVLHSSSDLCAAIVKLYCTYYLYYLVLCVSSNLCTAYLFYFSALTLILRALTAPTQLVPVTTSRHPRPLKSQWWHYHYGCLDSTFKPSALTFPHRFHPTNKYFQSWTSKPFFNHHAKFCETYLPLQAIFELTNQSKPCEKFLSFLNVLTAPPSHFPTNTPISVS